MILRRPLIRSDHTLRAINQSALAFNSAPQAGTLRHQMQLSLPQAMNLAASHLQAGRTQQAIALFRQILSIQPGHPGVLTSLGIALYQGGELQQAIVTLEEVTRSQPQWPDGWNNLGVVLHAAGRRNDAVQALRRVSELQPNSPIAMDNLGGALQDIGHYDEAIELHRKSIALRPDSVKSHANLANAFKFSNRIDESIASYREAISLTPNDPLLHHFLGLMLLYRGDYAEGFAEHEWRCRIQQPKQICQDFPQPRWQGEPLAGRRLLIHAEQGLGDTLLFIRYAKEAIARGGSIIVQCQRELCRLVRESIPGFTAVLSPADPLPAFDTHCPMMSLPYIFKTTVENAPESVPYLLANPQRAAQWSSRIAGVAGKKKIGIVWAGKTSYVDDRLRSIDPAFLAPLSQIANIQPISLQKNGAAAAASQAPPNTIDWTSELSDFADTAALIDSLDLVIAVDTAVAHLAAAMAKPTWVLLAHVPDWRWLPTGTTSHWYPTARLFRQSISGDWKPVIDQVRMELARLAHS